MRLFDWTNVLLMLAIIVGAASAALLAWFGATLVSGPVVTAEGEILDSPFTRTMGIFFLIFASGCVLSAAYCMHMLWDKYHYWCWWKSRPPGYPSWSITKEAEERRKR